MDLIPEGGEVLLIFFFLVFFGGLNLLGFFIALAGSLKASNSSSLEFPVLNLIFPRHKK